MSPSNNKLFKHNDQCNTSCPTMSRNLLWNHPNIKILTHQPWVAKPIRDARAPATYRVTSTRYNESLAFEQRHPTTRPVH